MWIFIVALFVWPFVAPEMWSFVIGQLILTFIVSVGTRENSYYDDGGFGSFFWWGFLGLVPYIAAFVILSNIYREVDEAPRERREVVARHEAILSLGHEVGVTGHFRLGYGSIDNVPFYAAYRRNADQGLEIVYIKGRSVLYENVKPPQQPYYRTFTIQERERRLNTPWIVRYITKMPESSAWRNTGTINRIYVPPGTVRQEFAG